ncbi:MAG: hypothetical protein C4297_14675 [Gemmataceae bacterium]
MPEGLAVQGFELSVPSVPNDALAHLAPGEGAGEDRAREVFEVCGVTTGELALVRRRRALDEAMRALDAHYAACGTCTTMGPWCEEGRRLRERYLDTWLRWSDWRGCPG